MKSSPIFAAKAPAAVGPYSHGYKCGNMVFTSGQLPLDPETGAFVKGGVAEQTRKSLENVRVVLEAAGSCIANIVKTTVYINDMNDFGKMNEVYASFFPTNPPARTCIEVARLPKDALVEVEAVAFCAE